MIPEEDQGAIFCNVQMPEGSTLERTQALMQELSGIYEKVDGMHTVMAITGYSLIGGNGENCGFMVCHLDTWDKRTTPELQIGAVTRKMQAIAARYREARINIFTPPPIMGMGISNGVDIRLQSISENDPQKLGQVMNSFFDGPVPGARDHGGLQHLFRGHAAPVPGT